MRSLTEKYKPTKLSAFAGLKMARAIMGKLTAGPWESAWLLVGAPGTGKTTLAMAVAAELNAELHHVPSSQCDKAAVERLVYDCNFVPMHGSGWHVVVVDEGDMMTVAAQNAFLSVLDGSGHFPKQTIFFFTCNGTKKLEARFTSRCKVIEFDGKVDAGEAGSFLYDVWFAEAPAWATAPLMHKILADANGNIREALNLIEMELLMLPAADPKRRVA